MDQSYGESLLSLHIVDDDTLRSSVFQEISGLDGDTESDEPLKGDGGLYRTEPWFCCCCCQGVLPGGDNATGTTFFTKKSDYALSEGTVAHFISDNVYLISILL